jgi:hypothetical protein
MEHITLEEYKQLQQKGKSKYKAKKTIVDGMRFDSQKEANRYLELKLLEKQGLIKYIDRQTRFELQPSYKKNGKTIRPIYYVADFAYIDVKTGKTIIEDVKSEATKTQVYRLKKKILEYKYENLEIKEV